MTVNPSPINVYSTPTTHGYGNTNQHLFGSNHTGVDQVDRIVMSLKSGIESEVEWALTNVYQVSYTNPKAINFEESEFLGQKLIHYFIKPFESIYSKKYDQISNSDITSSLNCLLAIRNAIQDIHNQQWISQIYEFKQDLINVLEFLNDWFFKNNTTFALQKFNDQFMEYAYHLVDVLDTLTCYYINNPKQDQLFNLLLHIALNSNDKYIIISSINCLTHLLFTRGETVEKENGETEAVPIHDNCIEVFTDAHLEHFINYLLINDNKSNLAVLEFLKQYLNSEAVYKNQSLAASKALRAEKILQLETSQNNLHTLFKQLPTLLTSGLLLNEPINDQHIDSSLAKRSKYSGAPASAASLPKDLYTLLLKFPEPLRATTWLRTTYEPVVDAEVTQISLWKAYERQFKDLFANKGKYPEHLPAVEFIKNVNAAFPYSEAMVVVSEDSDQTKKFIIKGIQPRQSVASIDIANYEAIKRTRPSVVHTDLPVGAVDNAKFTADLEALNKKILKTGNGLKLNKINLLSKDLLDEVINIISARKDANQLINVFRLYSKHWLLDLVYANPILIELELIDNNWLKYLI